MAISDPALKARKRAVKPIKYSQKDYLSLKNKYQLAVNERDILLDTLTKMYNKINEIAK